MMRRVVRLPRSWTFLLLAIQAVGGGAVSLAHARDVVRAPAAFEASHDGRCAILHDAVRCALCQFAGARGIVQAPLRFAARHASRALTAPVQRARTPAVPTPVTPPSRAPPSDIS